MTVYTLQDCLHTHTIGTAASVLKICIGWGPKCNKRSIICILNLLCFLDNSAQNVLESRLSLPQNSFFMSSIIQLVNGSAIQALLGLHSSL